MKKLYISIILIFSMFFITTKVSAYNNWDTPQPSIYGYDGDNQLKSFTTYSKKYFNLNWWCNSSSDTITTHNKNFYSFEYRNTGFDNSHNYDFSFLVRIPNISSTSTQTLDTQILATSGYYSCEVFEPKYIFMNWNYIDPQQGIGGVNYRDWEEIVNGGDVKAVVCRNQPLASTQYITIWTPSGDQRASVCVSQRFNYSVSTSQGLQDINNSVQNGNENVENAVKENTQATKEVNNTLKDSSVDNQQAEGFFNDFNDNSHGLSGIITAPLNMINNLASATCSSININIPFVNTEFTLPCMSTIYQQNFGSLFSIYRTITFGIVAYYVCVNIFALVKGFKDPENDKVEVVEL